LFDLEALQANEGRCTELEPLCRRLLATDPASSMAYECSADAISSTGGSLHTTRLAFSEIAKWTETGALKLIRARNSAERAGLSGHVAEATAAAEDWQAALGTVYSKLAAYKIRMTLYLELGRAADVHRVLHEFEAESRLWGRNTWGQVEGTEILLRSVVG